MRCNPYLRPNQLFGQNLRLSDTPWIGHLGPISGPFGTSSGTPTGTLTKGHWHTCHTPSMAIAYHPLEVPHTESYRQCCIQTLNEAPDVTPYRLCVDTSGCPIAGISIKTAPTRLRLVSWIASKGPFGVLLQPDTSGYALYWAI